MPVPLTVRPDLSHIEGQLRRVAVLLQRIGERPAGNKPHPELAKVAKLFTGIGDTLEKSVTSGRGVTSAQARSIATKLDAVADAIRKNA